MTSITLDSIKAEQTRLAEMIASFEKLSEHPALFFPEVTINLKPGEHYAGVILGKDGDSSYHLILVPGQADKINWKDAQVWAKGQGGELPTRREQSLLFANLKDQFDPNWYWSSESYEPDDAFAWCQNFLYGLQRIIHKDYTCRARAVRRLVFDN